MTLRWIRRLLAAGVLVIALVLLRVTWLRPEPVPVTVFRVAEGRVEDTVTNSRAGSVRSRRRVTIRPEIGGRVEAVPVRKGDRVARDAVLLRLNDEDYRAQYDLQERSFEAARASEREACRSVTLAEQELERTEPLVEAGILPNEALDRAQGRLDMAVAACEAARARAGQAEAAVRVARVNLAKTVLRAPFDAVVAEVSTEVGEWITPAPPGIPIPPVVELIDNSSTYISAPLDEIDVARVRPGLPVRMTLDAFTGRAFDGRVARIAPYVAEERDQSRTFEVEIEFQDGDHTPLLLPGTSADIEVILDVRDPVLRIPTYALIEGARVLVVRDGVLVSVPVRRGLSNWEFTEIVEGLAADDLVVVSLDRGEVREGAQVRIEAEAER